MSDLETVDGPVIVAVPLVGMMEVSVDEVIDMISMGNGFVSASLSMLVFGAMRAAGMARRAIGRIGGTDLDAVLVDMIGMRVVEMSIMKVVDVTVVTDCGMSASLAMSV